MTETGGLEGVGVSPRGGIGRNTTHAFGFRTEMYMIPSMNSPYVPQRKKVRCFSGWILAPSYAHSKKENTDK
jgi:hypothetical protein